MPQMNGRCLCGQIRYSATADPLMTTVCHCKHCQRQAGSAFSIVVGIPKSAFSLTGEIKTFQDKGRRSQGMLRVFCPECGSPIYTEAPAVLPDTIFIKAGTLDDTSWLRPTMEVYCDSAQSWVDLAGGMQRFAKMP